MICFPLSRDEDVNIGYILKRDEDRGDAVNLIKITNNDEYIGKIRKRLQEDAQAREEREKRRRKVLGEQMSAHQAQEVCCVQLESTFRKKHCVFLLFFFNYQKYLNVGTEH
jgi:hypothetical protein